MKNKLYMIKYKKSEPNENFNLNDTIELNDDINQKINLPNIFQNNFEKVENIYPTNTINKTEIYRTFNYSINDIKSKNFKISDIEKRLNFYLGIYHYINEKPNKAFYKITKNRKIMRNKYSFSIDFSNWKIEEEKEKKYEINFLDNNNSNNSKEKSIKSNNSINSKNKNINYSKNIKKEHYFINKSSNNESENTKEIILDNIKLTSSSNQRSQTDKERISQNNFIGKKRKLNYNNNEFLENSLKNNYKEDDFINNKNKSIQISDKKSKNNSKKNINNNIDNNSEESRNNNNVHNKNQNINNEENKSSINCNNLYTEKNPSKILLKRKINDTEFQNFKINLNDYLHRIIEKKREILFLDNVLPESRDFVKNIFNRQKIVKQNTKIPIFRNNYLELSLILKENGMIKKQILYKKE